MHRRFGVGVSFAIAVAMLASGDDAALLPRRLACLVVCVLLALEHSSAFETVRYRTYKLSSLIFCAGSVGHDVVPLAQALPEPQPCPYPYPCPYP